MDQATAQQESKVLVLPKGHGIARLVTAMPEVPENMDELLASGETVPLNFVLRAEASPEFAEWAEQNGVEYTIDLLEEGIRIYVNNEEHLLWIKLRWT